MYVKKKKKKRDWRDFLLKKTIVIWTLIFKTNGIGQSSIHQLYKWLSTLLVHVQWCWFQVHFENRALDIWVLQVTWKYMYYWNRYICILLFLMHSLVKYCLWCILSKLIKDKKIIKSQIMKNKENTKNKIWYKIIHLHVY